MRTLSEFISCILRFTHEKKGPLKFFTKYTTSQSEERATVKMIVLYNEGQQARGFLLSKKEQKMTS